MYIPGEPNCKLELDCSLWYTIVNTSVLYLDIYLGVEVTRNVVQCPIHNVTYAAAKFEAVSSHDLKSRCIYK